VALLLISGGAAWFSATRTKERTAWVDHSHRVLYQLEAVLADLLNMQSAVRGFLLTGEERFLEPYHAGRAQIQDSLPRLRELTADNPAQQAQARELTDAAGHLMDVMRGRIEARRGGGYEAAAEPAALIEGKAAMDRVRGLVAALQEHERTLLDQRSEDARKESRRTFWVTAVGGSLALTVVGAAAFWVHADLRARLQAEAERDRFFALSVDMLCIASADGYFKRVSPAFSLTLGWTEPELLARPYLDFVHPDDRAATLREVERQVKAGEPVLHFENRYRHKDGSWRILSWRSVPHGGLMYATARDATELKASEEKIRQQNRRLHAIFESLPGLCLVLTPELRIVNATDAYLKATMTEREKIRDRHLFEVFPENPANPADDGVRNLRASLERVRHGAAADTMAIQKYDVRRPDGAFEERFWSPINSRVIDATGQLEYIIHRVEDVTDFVRRKSTRPGSEQDLRVQLERMETEVYRSAQKIQAVNRRLEETNAELESFSYSVSHDLRAPLRHIDGFAALLQKNAAAQLDATARRHLDFISGAARQMGRLIDDLLSFSRMGRATLQPTHVDQNALVAVVVREGRYAQSHPAVDWRIDPLPAAHGDPAMLQQVWANLIDNAVKYSAKTPRPRIEISAYPAGAEQPETVYFVRDNGAGFDPRYIDKLFGVFQRLHAATEFEGTGIGLANVRRIITRHGGRTWAEGRPGAGAAFYFSLPAGPASSAGNGHSPS